MWHPSYPARLRYEINGARHTAAELRLEDLKAERVLAFLENVEQERNNCTATRNLRLAALRRTFFQYMISEDTVRSGQ